MIDYLKEICISLHCINSKLYNLQYFCSEIHYLSGSGTPGLSDIVTKKPFECSRVNIGVLIDLSVTADEECPKMINEE